MITHYDLFAGIGGFSIALEEVFTNDSIRHVFCEWEKFPSAVLKQHWPDGEFWGDIADLVAHTNERESRPRAVSKPNEAPQLERSSARRSFTIVTGGFPCQPFSQAGRRKGTADDRYQWPNMYEIIRNVKPKWVIAENVRGLVTWNDGMVLEQVCTDLESEGYEVQPFIIPAVAVNAPHRRDRVWIIAYAIDSGQGRTKPEVTGISDSVSQEHRSQHSTSRQSERANSNGNDNRFDEKDNSNPHDTGLERCQEAGNVESSRPESEQRLRKHGVYPSWQRDWREVALATCNESVDDGLSRLVDGVPYTRAKWRKDSLKAYGNGIVPQVAIEIMKSIKESEDHASQR